MSQSNEYLTSHEQELLGRSNEFDRARAVVGAAELACMLGLTPEHTQGLVTAFRLEVGKLDAEQAAAVRGHLAEIMATLCQSHGAAVAEEVSDVPLGIASRETLVEVPAEPSIPLHLQPPVERATSTRREADPAQSRGLTQAAQSVLHEVFGDTTALFGDEVGTTGVSEDDAATIARTIMQLRGPIQVRPNPVHHEARLKALFDGCAVTAILESTGEHCSPAAAYVGIHNIVKKITERPDFSQEQAYAQLAQAIDALEQADDRPVVEIAESTPPPVEEVVPMNNELTGQPEVVQTEDEAGLTRLLQKVISLLSPEAKHYVTEDMAMNELSALVQEAYATIYATDGSRLLDCYLEYVTHEQPLKEVVKKHKVSYDDAGKLVAMMPRRMAQVANERYAQLAPTPTPTPLAMPSQKTLTYQPPRAYDRGSEATPLEDKATPAPEAVLADCAAELVPTPLTLAALNPHETSREEWISPARELMNRLAEYGFTKDEVNALWRRMHYNSNNKEMTGDTLVGLRKLKEQLAIVAEDALPSEATKTVLGYFVLGGENHLAKIHEKVKRPHPEVKQSHVERHVAAGIEAIVASYAATQS